MSSAILSLRGRPWRTKQSPRHHEAITSGSYIALAMTIKEEFWCSENILQTIFGVV